MSQKKGSMLTIASAIMIGLSIMILSVLAFGPNYISVIDDDFKQLAETNSLFYAAQYGQLAYKTGQLTAGNELYLENEPCLIENECGTGETTVIDKVACYKYRVTLVEDDKGLPTGEIRAEMIRVQPDQQSGE